VEVSAETELLQLDFVGPEDFRRPAHGVISRMVKIENVMRVEPDFRGEEL
jgi:hypothetical protein